MIFHKINRHLIIRSDTMTKNKKENVSKTIKIANKNYLLLELVCSKKGITKSEYINSLLTEKFKNIDKDLISQLENNLQDL